jgi:hypothetical protein
MIVDQTAPTPNNYNFTSPNGPSSLPSFIPFLIKNNSLLTGIKQGNEKCFYDFKDITHLYRVFDFQFPNKGIPLQSFTI